MSRQHVREHYGEVARMVAEAEIDEATGFRIVTESRTACPMESHSEALEIYGERLIEGIPRRALVASRGCGDPVSKADLKLGETVLDLGCGGGVDAIIAARLVGPSGRVYGLDMTAEMIELASENARAAGAGNVKFLEGLIEKIPLPDASVDVVLSNCVINFSENRAAALREARRVLKPGGRFVVSDIVEFAPVPKAARTDLCAIAGTTNGMLRAGDYLHLLEEAGFTTAELEPKTIYTRDVLLEKAQRKGRMENFDRIAELDVDSKTGSAIIIAHVDESDERVPLSGSVDDQPARQTNLPVKRVLMFLAKGFEDVEAVCALDMLGWTHYRPSIATAEVDITGLHERVKGAFGTEFAIDVPLSEVNPARYDALVVPGGFHNLGFDEAYDERLRELARSLHGRGCPIATMCTGILPIAEAGLLAGGVAATYALSSRHDNPGRLRELGCTPSDEHVVEWRGIISCSGPAHSELVMHRFLSHLVGDAAADEVKRYRGGLS